MDHATAVQARIGEKYLLGELAAAQEDEFAEHFFGCDECAADLRMTSLFLETSKKVLAEDAASKAKVSNKWWNRRQPTGYAVAASIALFAVTAFQNLVTIPQLRQALAPQAVSYFALTGIGSRGDSDTPIHPVNGRPFLLTFDIPPQQPGSAYRAQILGPAGEQVMALDITEEMAKKTVPLLIPGSMLKPGDYSLALSSRPANGSDFQEFAKYPLRVK